MKILKKEIRNGAGKLSKTQVAFLQHVLNNPQVMERQRYRELKLSDVRSNVVQPWPLFLDKRQKAEFSDCAVRVFDLFRSIPGCIFENDLEAISRYYEAPLDEVKRWMVGYRESLSAQWIGRGDFIYTSTGIKCLEYNMSGGVGGLTGDLLEHSMMNLPVLREFFSSNRVKILNTPIMQSLLKHAFNSAVDTFQLKDEEVTIAFLIIEYKKGNHYFLDAENSIKEHCRAVMDSDFKSLNLKGDVVYCSCDELELKDQCVYYNGKRIYAAVDSYHGDLPPDIISVFEKGNLLLFNGPITRLVSQKLNLAVLSEHENSEKLTVEERETIKKHIPWTRKVKPGETVYNQMPVNMERFLITNKNNLVLKPSVGLGGTDVYVGRYVPEIQWKGLVEVAFEAGAWVVQEYVESIPYVLQRGENDCGVHHAVWGTYVFGSRHNGFLLRVISADSPGTGVVNVAQGAEAGVVFEVEE